MVVVASLVFALSQRSESSYMLYNRRRDRDHHDVIIGWML